MLETLTRLGDGRRRRAARGTPAASLDHLVGAGEERGRDREAEGLRGLEIDHQLELGRLLHGQIGGLLAFKNAADV